MRSILIRNPIYGLRARIRALSSSLGPITDFDAADPRKRVAIVGAGVGGAALGLALQRLGIPFRIYERDASASTRRQGYALTLQQGLRAMRYLGFDVEASVLPRGATSDYHAAFKSDGTPIGRYGPPDSPQPNRQSREYSSGAARSRHTESGNNSPAPLPAGKKERKRNVHIPRQALRALFLEQLEPGVVHWGAHIKSFTEDPKSSAAAGDGRNGLIRLHLQSEKSDQASPVGNRGRCQDGEIVVPCALLVGADGVYSAVRGMLAGKQPHRGQEGGQHGRKMENLLTQRARGHANGGAAATLRYLNLMMILGICPNDPAEDSTARREQRQWVDGSARCFTMPFDKRHRMWQLSWPMGEHEALELSGFLQGPSCQQQRGVRDPDRELNYAEKLAERLRSAALDTCRGWDKRLVRLLECTPASLISGHPVYDREPFLSEGTLQPDDFDESSEVWWDANRSPDCSGGENPAYKAASGDQAPFFFQRSACTLIGDAAHPMGPFKAQGANQCLLDVLSLAQALSVSVLNPDCAMKNETRARPLALALDEYETEMSARSAVKVEASRAAGIALHSPAALVPADITRASAARAASAVSPLSFSRETRCAPGSDPKLG